MLLNLLLIQLKVIRLGPCAHPKVECRSQETNNINETLSYNQYGRYSICQGKCPIGVSGQNCHKCMHAYWGYTSFGCKGKVFILLIFLYFLILP